MSRPTVSVIMNCYNSATYLQEALESVVAQSFQGWELIFWDNQSVDSSAEIFKGFNDPRFCYYRAECHTNLGQARNLAVAKARGSWLAFLDCDDTWSPDKLEKQLKEIENSEGVIGLVYAPVEYNIVSKTSCASIQGSYYSRVKASPHHGKYIYNDLLINGNNIIFSTLLVRSDLYRQVGGIDDTLSQNEDYDLILKVSRIATAACIENIGATYRIHDTNNSYKQSELGYQESFRIYRALPRDRYVERALKLNASRFGVYLVKNGEIVKGLKILFTEGSLWWSMKRSFTRLFESIWIC